MEGRPLRTASQDRTPVRPSLSTENLDMDGIAMSANIGRSGKGRFESSPALKLRGPQLNPHTYRRTYVQRISPIPRRNQTISRTSRLPDGDHGRVASEQSPEPEPLVSHHSTHHLNHHVRNYQQHAGRTHDLQQRRSSNGNRPLLGRTQRGDSLHLLQGQVLCLYRS